VGQKIKTWVVKEGVAARYSVEAAQFTDAWLVSVYNRIGALLAFRVYPEKELNFMHGYCVDPVLKLASRWGQSKLKKKIRITHMSYTLAKARRDAVNHWKRMINWAKKQHPKATPNQTIMEQEIGESWEGKYCVLCSYSLAIADSCGKCPLYKKYGSCDYDPRNAYGDVSDRMESPNWKQWVVNAERLLKQLESL
jgi:hypothetical protein